MNRDWAENVTYWCCFTQEESLKVIILLQSFCFTLWSDEAGGMKQSITNQQAILFLSPSQRKLHLLKVNKSGPDSSLLSHTWTWDYGLTALSKSEWGEGSRPLYCVHTHASPSSYPTIMIVRESGSLPVWGTANLHRCVHILPQFLQMIISFVFSSIFPQPLRLSRQVIDLNMWSNPFKTQKV